MDKYWLGIDGGGTKSRLMARDRDGNIYGPWFGGSTNISSNPREAVIDNIAALFGHFLKARNARAENVASLCIGSAGIDVPENVATLTGILREAGIHCPVRVVNDVEIVLESEAEGQPGAVLISGTGSVAFGRNSAGRTHRTGGWGHLVGDEGSGYWIAQEAVRRSLWARDGRIPATAMSDLICEAMGLRDISDIIPRVYGTNKSELAKLGRYADQAAEAGDEAALSIMREAAAALSGMAEAIWNKLDLQGADLLVLSGGTVLHSGPLSRELTPLLSRFCDNVRPVAKEPCMGAIYMAMEMEKNNR